MLLCTGKLLYQYEAYRSISNGYGPGQSITLNQGQYHTWRGVPGTGKVMLFEVSMTNDDHLDNRFKTAAGRIPEVEEDEEIEHLMFADYDKVRK